MPATWDALGERLQIVRETASFLYNGMMENMGYGREGLKNIGGKEAEEQKQKPTATKVEEEAKKQQQEPAAAKGQ